MSRTKDLSSNRLVVKNVVWNLTGIGMLFLIALYSIPQLISGMGTERYGLLNIIWMGVGYFSIFDMGIGRALTKLVAERLGNGREAELPNLIHTGLLLMWGLGSIASLLAGIFASWIVSSVLNIPQWLQREAVWSFWIFAATLPFVISSAGLIGVLQAHQSFVQINLVRVPLGIAQLLGPVLVIIYTPSLVATTFVLALSRILAWIAYYVLCKPLYRRCSEEVKFDGSLVRMILRFGGWITVTNIISPLMVYFDRFVIGAVVGLSAVAYYATPYELVTRLWALPQAMMGVLFPAFSATLVTNPEHAAELFKNSAKVLLIAMFIPVALLVLFAPEFLGFWINADFAVRGSGVMRFLLLGVYINCLAWVPYDILQSHGRPDITAKLHLFELPVYVVVLFVMLGNFGIIGVAMTWTFRMIIDALLLYYLTIRIIPKLRAAAVDIVVLTAIAIFTIGGLWVPEAMPIKYALGAASLLFPIVLSWYQFKTLVLEKRDR